MRGVLVHLLGQVGANGLRQTAPRGFLVAADRNVVLLDIENTPENEEIDEQRLLFRRRDPVRLRVVEHLVDFVVVLDVLHERHLEIQSRVRLGLDHFTQLKLDRILALVHRIDRLRGDEQQRDDQREDRHREFHR